MPIILASQSPYRQALLKGFGLPFLAKSPAVNEDELKARAPGEPVALSRFLAMKKAESLRAQFPDALIIGCDQLADLEGTRLDKPGTRERAREQLRQLAGRTHRLITSMAVLRGEEHRLYTDITAIRLRKLDEKTIDAYLDLDQPFDCAGSYKMERAGLALVEELRTQDPSAIQGLSLIQLTQAFSDFGISLADLWRKE